MCQWGGEQKYTPLGVVSQVFQERRKSNWTFILMMDVVFDNIFIIKLSYVGYFKEGNNKRRVGEKA